MATSTTKILDEVNEVNLPKYPLVDDLNVNLLNVAPIEAEDANTVLTIQAKPGRSYTGEVEIRYKRLDLSAILAGADLRSTEPFTEQMIIDLLNTQFQLFLTLEDFEDFDPPALELDQSATLTLVAKADSRGFYGSAEIDLMYGKTLLESVVGSRTLREFNHPDVGISGFKSARMMTWGQDFTSLRDAIKPKAVTLLYSDWTALQAACTYLRIPSWKEGTIQDYPTSEIADSNQSFDRVVIQRNVSSSEMRGDVYLHYNNLEEV